MIVCASACKSRKAAVELVVLFLNCAVCADDCYVILVALCNESLHKRIKMRKCSGIETCNKVANAVTACVHVVEHCHDVSTVLRELIRMIGIDEYKVAL